MEQLHRGGWQAGLAGGFESLFGGELRHGRMAGVGLGDHGVAGGDRRGHVAPGHTAVGEREVGRGKDHDRADPEAGGADVFGGVEHRHPPGLLAGASRRLPQLVEGSRQLHIGEPRLHGQARLGMGRRHEFRAAGLEPGGEAFQEGRDPLDREPRELGCGGHRRVQGLVAVGPRAHRPDGLPRGRRGGINSLKRGHGLGGPPPAGDENRFGNGHARPRRSPPRRA